MPLPFLYSAQSPVSVLYPIITSYSVCENCMYVPRSVIMLADNQ